MNGKITLDFIEYPQKPDDIWIAIREVVHGEDKREYRKIEKKGGRKLVADIVTAKLGNGNFDIRSSDNKKPVATYNGQPVHISITHSGRLICGAVSRERVLGIDMESVSRKTIPGLKKRILHDDEAALTTDIAPLQLWTIKEAALKWSGRGLRAGMNTIRIISIRKPFFYLTFPDGKCLKILSFTHNGYWMSIAYEKK